MIWNSRLCRKYANFPSMAGEYFLYFVEEYYLLRETLFGEIVYVHYLH